MSRRSIGDGFLVFIYFVVLLDWFRAVLIISIKIFMSFSKFCNMVYLCAYVISGYFNVIIW